jgi:hypothetical protein
MILFHKNSGEEKKKGIVSRTECSTALVMKFLPNFMR